MRQSTIQRKTYETDISLTLSLDGSGKCSVDSGNGFFDHMITLFAKHGNFDIALKCNGDTNVDFHHSAEDIGICLGKAFFEALGDKKGIMRYGSMILPMDEALVIAAVDLSGRDALGYALNIPAEKVGDFDTELVKELWLGFVREAKCALHLNQLAGDNSHHIIEGAFKAAGRAFKAAVAINPEAKDEIPSTKGVL